MALDLGGLAAALRITDGANPEEPIAGILNRLLAVSEAVVELQAPNAPDEVQDEARIRLCGLSLRSTGRVQRVELRLGMGEQRRRFPGFSLGRATRHCRG